MKRFILFFAAVTLGVTTAEAQHSDDVAAKNTKHNDVVSTVDIVRDVVDSASVEEPTNGRFLPMRQRINRNVDRNKFVYRGEVMLGLAASYGTMKASDADLLLLLDNINFNLNRVTVKPFVAYAYRDNRSVGMRFGYEQIKGGLDNLDVDLGSANDIALSLSGLGLENRSYSWSVFHRNYIGLDRRGIVGAIIESELLVKTGTSSFSFSSDGDVNYSKSRNFAAKLNFNPGLAVYVFPQVCVTVTVGIGGLYYNNVRQEDLYGVETGRRDRTGLKFKFNIADIQIGIVAHLWNKKKD